VPVEVAGCFHPHGDRDWYTFDAPKGAVYWIEVIGQRMGLPCNPSVLIQRVTHDAKGVEQSTDVQEITGVDVNVGGPAFRTSTRDGAFRLDAKAGGTYRLLVRDLFNTAQDNAALTYRLSIHTEHPDFRMLALPVAGPTNDIPLWTTFLRRGGIALIRVILSRQDGFNVEVRVGVEGLPAGLICKEITIPAGQNIGTLAISADDTVSEWSGQCRIVGRANVNQQELVREARIGEIIWPSPNAQEPAVSRLAQEFMLSVSGNDEEPVRFDVGDKAYEVSVAGKVNIGVKIHRNAAMKSPLRVTFAGLGVLATPPELVLPPDASEGSLELDTAAFKLPVGTYTFVLQGQGQASYQRVSLKSADPGVGAKTNPLSAQATCYSPLLTLNVVQRGKGKGR
jgi:hypothetical protein